MKTATVYAYDRSIEPAQEIPIVTGATAFDDPGSGRTYILLFHEALLWNQTRSQPDQSQPG